jgi:hypothetical protein
VAQAQFGNGTNARKPSRINEQNALNSALIRVKMMSAGHGNFSYGALEEDLFPNGKIWWQYPMWADKLVAFIVHANWNKSQKKARLMRDHLWFLSDGDSECAVDFDPLVAGCNKLCVPVESAPPGIEPSVLKTCRALNREDDRKVMKHSRQSTTNSSTRADLRGQFWHPIAYAALKDCVRNTSVVAPFAAEIYTALWNEPGQG